ncbi:hypothetical protein B7494_g38 [Chlorociboria aeruginascens]|nr:hypothetical protein B7494_g38 [Chlorociboria aeruginascens]
MGTAETLPEKGTQPSYPLYIICRLGYHLKTMYLFTCSDHEAVLYPFAFFGIFSALSGYPLTNDLNPEMLSVAGRLPLVFAWLWLNLLAFAISNQRLPTSIVEDSMNKCWRPLPAARLSPAQAQKLLLLVIPLVLLLSTYLGVLQVSMAGLVVTWMYNDLGGSDENYVIRSLLNALGLSIWSIGSTVIACGVDGNALNPISSQWFAIEAAIIFTTLHVQDLRDQEGDRARGRKTPALVWGDGITRWTIAIPILAWSTLAPAFWSLRFFGFVLPVAMGVVMTSRVLLLRNVQADRMTLKLWGLWIGCLFLLPLFKNPAAISGYFM